MISISHIFDGKAANLSKPTKVIPAMADAIKKEPDPVKREKKKGLFTIYQNKVLSRYSSLR